MQQKIDVGLMRVMIQMINTVGIDQGRSPLHAVHDIILRQKQLGEQSTVLTSDAGNQSNFF
jgi:hypothetical protein